MTSSPPTETDPATKTCRRCGAHKPVAEFGTDARTRDGWSHLCLACDRRDRGDGHAPSLAELYAVLEAVLPFAESEVECIVDFAANFADDPDYPDEAEQARRGKKAIARARRLLARKPSHLATGQHA
jgi:hypothetical protein